MLAFSPKKMGCRSQKAATADEYPNARYDNKASVETDEVVAGQRLSVGINHPINHIMINYDIVL